MPEAATPRHSSSPLPRAPTVEHHWLTLLVARSGPHEPVPASGARVVVRPFVEGASKPSDPIARGTAGPDGTVSLLLPTGRYAVAAHHAEDGKCVTITLEHGGRAVLLLESLGRRIALTVEASRFDGRALCEAPVEVRCLPGGTVAARGTTDERGAATLHVPPGAYEVRVGEATARTYVELDTLLRLTAEPGIAPTSPPPTTAYQQKVRAATTYSAAFDVEGVRDDHWN